MRTHATVDAGLAGFALSPAIHERMVSSRPGLITSRSRLSHAFMHVQLSASRVVHQPTIRPDWPAKATRTGLNGLPQLSRTHAFEGFLGTQSHGHHHTISSPRSGGCPPCRTCTASVGFFDCTKDRSFGRARRVATVPPSCRLDRSAIGFGSSIVSTSKIWTSSNDEVVASPKHTAPLEHDEIIHPLSRLLALREPTGANVHIRPDHTVRDRSDLNLEYLQ